MSRLSRVFIEFIHPSIRELTAEKKGWWDIGSYANGWRHARLVVTTKPVPFISSDVQGDVYDAGKDPKSKLVPIYEKFTPTSLNRYLAVGPLKATINDDEIKRLCKYRLTAFLLGYLVSFKSLVLLTKILCSEHLHNPKPKLRIYG